MANTALVLLSGGLDSTLNCYLAAKELSLACALTVDYGQRAFSQELAAAQRTCKALNIEHLVLDLKPVFSGVRSSLVDRSQSLPLGDDINIGSLEQSQKTAQSVWVPNRNGVLLNVAACVAESMGLDFVIPGFNKEEAETFPDNSADYIQALNNAFSFSTMNKVQVKCFTHEMNKAEMYRLSKELSIPEENIWSCYQNGDTPCGKCESCLRTERARKVFEGENA